MRKFLNKIKGIGMGALAAIAALGLGMSAHAADIDTGFDATSTQSILSQLFANVSPTLKVGIVAVLGIGLGIWVLFFLVGKLKKHTK